LIENNGGQISNEKEVLLIISKFKQSSVRKNEPIFDSAITLEEYLEEMTPKLEHQPDAEVLVGSTSLGVDQ
jgi:hypothetical protein